MGGGCQLLSKQLSKRLLTLRGWCFSQNLDQSNCIRFSDWFLRLNATVLHLQVEKNDVRSSLLLFCDMNFKNPVKHFSYCPQQTIHPFAIYQSPHVHIMPSRQHFGIQNNDNNVKCLQMTLVHNKREPNRNLNSYPHHEALTPHLLLLLIINKQQTV